MDRNELQLVRAVSPGLSFRDYRAISENVQGLVAMHARKRFKPQKLLPSDSSGTAPAHRVLPNFVEIIQPEAGGGRFSTAEENQASTPVVRAGRKRKVSLLGYDNASAST